jgi:signal transduction histidine kinase
VIGLYEKHKQFIGSIPQRVASRQYEKKVLMKCGDLLSSLLSAAYRIDNDTLGAEIGGIMDRLIQSIRTTYATDAEVLIRLQYSIVMAEHEKYRTAGDVKGIWKCILQLDSLLNDAHTPAYLKSYIGFATTDKKALYFLDTRKNDSAKHYVGLLNAHYGANISVPFNAYMVKKYEARLLYNDGHYKESEDTLAKSLEILETATSGMTTEVDEVMYALTEVEDQQLLLAESARREKQADRNLMLLSFGSFTLLVGSALVLMLVRRRQKTRFLNFKLHLAQNIHDETNPALLYAKMLAKEQRVSQSDEKTGELEKHIDHTMELIRSLSKDLRSDEHLLLADLVQDVREMIGKISKLSDFSYTIQEPKDMKRFLSHYQYTNLNAILQECVTNSIKHADFKRVSVAFSIQASMLKVVYKDDGRGWEPSQEPQGIGLKNMQERMARLNGDMAIENDYPNGFQITLSVKLS